MGIFKDILLVGAGSFFGGIARYLVSLAMKGMSAAFPWATMTANIAGCFIIGALWAVLNRYNADNQLNLLLAVGFCGGFTTFSTFSKEGLCLLQSGNYFIKETKMLNIHILMPRSTTRRHPVLYYIR